MKKYQLIITIAVVVILGAAVATAQWSDPQTLSVSNPEEKHIPVNSSNVLQIKQNAGLVVGDPFLVTENAQFDQAVLVAGTIRGGNNPRNPDNVYFGGPVNEVGIEANGTFYVRDEITSPSLATGNNTVKQVCADQYGFLSLCQ